VYALFFDVPRSERIFTIVVLLIATVQIIVTRPRRAPPVPFETSVTEQST